jgi:hypothetical protein
MENDGTVSMNIFAGTLSAGTILVFLGQFLPEKAMWWVSVIGAVIVAGGLLWISTRRINIREHAAEDLEHKKH